MDYVDPSSLKQRRKAALRKMASLADARRQYASRMGAMELQMLKEQEAEWNAMQAQREEERRYAEYVEGTSMQDEVAQGAALGAQAGSIIPGLGTAWGALIGAVAGTAVGAGKSLDAISKYEKRDLQAKDFLDVGGEVATASMYNPRKQEAGTLFTNPEATQRAAKYGQSMLSTMRGSGGFGDTAQLGLEEGMKGVAAEQPLHKPGDLQWNRAVAGNEMSLGTPQLSNNMGPYLYQDLHTPSGPEGGWPSEKAYVPNLMEPSELGANPRPASFASSPLRAPDITYLDGTGPSSRFEAFDQLGGAPGSKKFYY